MTMITSDDGDDDDDDDDDVDCSLLNYVVAGLAKAKGDKCAKIILSRPF